MRLRGLMLAVALAGAARSPAQAPPWDWKVDPHLRARLVTAAADEELAVYLVMRDRLGYHSFFPRVQMMHVDERRAVVVRELKEHAARAQAPVWDYLCRERERGNARDLFANWLGNFIEVRATAAVIGRAAALDAVWEVHLDAPRPPAAVRNSVQNAAPAPAGAGPGSGPAEVNAYPVWLKGFLGRGVLALNADDGINYFHRGLMNAVWENPGEIAGNGIDDDGNGFVDDYYGWNFAANSPEVQDLGSHGTQTAGVMVGGSACGPILGIAPNAKLVTAVINDETDQWAAIQYALDLGVHVQTSQYSFSNNLVLPPNYAMHRDIGELTLAAGLIRTNSTSNNGQGCHGTSPAARPFNVAVPGNLPAPYRDPNQLLWGRKGGVIGVGAYQVSTGQLDPDSPCGPSAWDLGDLLTAVPAYPLAWWDPLDSDFPWRGGLEMGLLKPDVVAPNGTQTTVGAGSTCAIGLFGGTSNATPIVAGCIMLWKGANMSLTPEDVGMIVHQTARDQGSVPGKENTWGAGKIDALAGLERALCVHRANGEPAWEVLHRSGTDLVLEVDGSPNQLALIAVGLVRQDVQFGPVTSGIGAQLFQAFAGLTDATGSARVVIPVQVVGQAFEVHTQTFLDDRTGPTGKILSSNVITVKVTP